MKKQKAKPLIVTIQGPTASGKTTLATILYKTFKHFGHDVKIIQRMGKNLDYEYNPLTTDSSMFGVLSGFKEPVNLTIIDDASSTRKFDNERERKIRRKS